MRYLLLVLLLTGCVKEGGWVRPNATDDEWHRDRGACIAQMEAVPFAGSAQKARVFSGCMQSRGWYWEESR